MRVVTVAIGQLCQAEIEDLQSSVERYEQILRLQITMNYSLFVRRCKSMRRLKRKTQCLANRHRSAADHLAKCLALEPLRNDIRRAVVRLNVVDRKDIRMI